MDKVKINVVVGDITTIDTEVIVNAANSALLGGGGVDGAIHMAGGLDILKECKNLRATKYPDGLPVGEATITHAGNLKARYVIHTVGPRYMSATSPQKLLESCYRNSLMLADKYKCKSIAFPAISTGIYGYPKKEAATIAYKTIVDEMQKCKYIKNIVFVFYSKDDAEFMRTLEN